MHDTDIGLPMGRNAETLAMRYTRKTWPTFLSWKT